MTDNESVDRAVLDLLTPGVYVAYERIVERAKAAGLDLDGRALHDALVRLAGYTPGTGDRDAGAPVTLTYGRGYLRPSPYDTGEILEPRVWENNGRIERFGRVDFDNDESATEVTVWVERGPDGPIVHVIAHSDDVTVSQE